MRLFLLNVILLVTEEGRDVNWFGPIFQSVVYLFTAKTKFGSNTSQRAYYNSFCCSEPIREPAGSYTTKEMIQSRFQV